MVFIMLALPVVQVRAGEELPPQPAVQAPADTSSFVKNDDKWVKAWNYIEPSVLWYLQYAWGEEKGESYNRASVTRGYLTLKLKPVKWFTPRITLDTTQESGGDFKVRLKYLYGQLVLPVETDFITEPNVEFGIVHVPWFDFEQSIYRYRAQGAIFIERNKVLNSADIGVTVGALLGSKLSKDYQEKISKYDPGKWGSLSFGIYNGGGYNAVENNQNKVFQSRVSLRPLGWILPNLQLSHLFIFGKGNTPKEICDENNVCKPGEPDWMLNLIMASFEHQY
ncbi:MAG: hypothetical protein N3E40_07395, partial [Dehalococcoidia bacterium]|nr:hypothetical protein [Dehalococcoidia bacterium]